MPQSNETTQKPEVVFHDSYTGSRWTYGFRNRPPGYAHNPKYFVVGSAKDHPDFNYGTMDWPRPLDPKEVYDYELELVQARITPDDFDTLFVYPSEVCWKRQEVAYFKLEGDDRLYIADLAAEPGWYIITAAPKFHGPF